MENLLNPMPYVRLISLSKEDFEDQESAGNDDLDRFSLNDEEEAKCQTFTFKLT